MDWSNVFFIRQHVEPNCHPQEPCPSLILNLWFSILSAFPYKSLLLRLSFNHYLVVYMPAPMPTLSFKCALITGGGGGLGRAMAGASAPFPQMTLIKKSKHNSAASEIGATACCYSLDTPSFVSKVTEAHPEFIQQFMDDVVAGWKAE